MLTSDGVKCYCHSIGIDLVGVTDTSPFARWTKESARTGAGLPRPSDPDHALGPLVGDLGSMVPAARSIIVIGCRYLPSSPSPTSVGQGIMAREHWNKVDAHLSGKASTLIGFLVENGANVYDVQVPVKAAAHRAGLGTFGKNTLIQNEDWGSWLLLRAIVTDLDLGTDEELEPRCGACQRCLRLCPTKAIREPYVLDASRCLALILSSPGPIPLELREGVGLRIWGCDLCQEVCPRNESVPAVDDAEDRFGTGTGRGIDLGMITTDEETWRSRLGGWLVERPSALPLLRRNMAVAIGNSGEIKYASNLVTLLTDEDPVVRGHAAWALARLGHPDASDILTARLQYEHDPSARGEMESALEVMVHNGEMTKD